MQITFSVFRDPSESQKSLATRKHGSPEKQFMPTGEARTEINLREIATGSLD